MVTWDTFDAKHLPRPAGAAPSPSNGQDHPIEGMRALSDLMDRYQLASRAGMTFGGDRDLYSALGYKRSLTLEDYRERYLRGGIAARVVDAFPKATWRAGTELVEDDDPEVDTQLEIAWNELDERLGLWVTFLRADILAGIGPYSVILLGAEGELNEPLERIAGPEKLMYLAPYAADEALLESLVEDPADPRFGMPETYKLRRKHRTSVGTKNFEKVVHWSRVIHVLDGQLDDKINGIPRLQRVWNDLDNLDKVTGGGSEAFWLRVHQGFAINVDKEVKMSTSEVNALKDAAEEFAHQMRRTLAMKGAELDALGSDVSDFKNQVESLISLISGATGIPQRLLLGSERGELASTQDKENWDERVQDRRQEFAEPLVRQFVGRLMELGVLPETDEYKVQWPEIEELNEKERAQVAVMWAGLNEKAKGPVVLPEEIRDRVLRLEPLSDEEVEAYEEAHQPLELEPEPGQEGGVQEEGTSGAGGGGEQGPQPPAPQAAE